MITRDDIINRRAAAYVAYERASSSTSSRPWPYEVEKLYRTWLTWCWVLDNIDKGIDPTVAVLMRNDQDWII